MIVKSSFPGLATIPIGALALLGTGCHRESAEASRSLGFDAFAPVYNRHIASWLKTQQEELERQADARHRAERAVAQQADRTRAILDSVLVGIVTVGPQGIEWMNRSARRMFGGDLADFLHLPIATVATEWMRNDEATFCMRCSLQFGAVTRRRHHCRHCGGVFCDACSGQRIPLLKLALDSGARAAAQLAAELGPAQPPGDDRLDVIVIGGGVSGMATAIECVRLGLRCLVVEASQPFATIANFPARKRIFTYPTAMTPRVST